MAKSKKKSPVTSMKTKGPARPASGVRLRSRNPARNVVNRRQTPWGLITTVIVLMLFAAGVVGYAVTRSSAPSNRPPYLSELAAAKAIRGITFHPEPDRNHVTGISHYDTSPPVGGAHSATWADCTGTTYQSPIASENAVHSLEHGAVWVTYRPGLSRREVSDLEKHVIGQADTLISPYPGLKAPISVQSWGYQLFVDAPSDPRLSQFIATLRANPTTTPEPGASCANDAFKTNPSNPGHPA